MLAWKNGNIWLASAGIPEGAIFRRLVGSGRVGEKLHSDIISDIYKRVARWIGMSEKQVNQVSGHSVLVPSKILWGLTRSGPVMQAGRWKSTRMPMRYGEEYLSGRGAMARAAAVQGRNRGAIDRMNSADRDNVNT
jgi:hypothetical protein